MIQDFELNVDRLELDSTLRREMVVSDLAGGYGVLITFLSQNNSYGSVEVNGTGLDMSNIDQHLTFI